MSDFFKKFLLEDPRRFSPGGRYVALAAFGKHPGWDDHVEDLGLETESLNFAKRVLYVNGIGGQIDSGAWEKLDENQQLPAFKHAFVWQRSGQILVGRLWSSSDGKGRKRYPLVVCIHFMGVTLGWALRQGLPALAEMEQGCVNTTSAVDVRSLLNRKRAALREAIQFTNDRGEYAPVSPDTLNKILRPSAEAKPEGFLRVLYQLQSQLGAFAIGTFNARANPSAIRAQQIRVPIVGENAEQALLFWTRFFLTQVDPSAPLLLTLPLEEGWVDVTVGEPDSHEFFCLRASPRTVPLVSEVPYTIDEAFRAKAMTFLDRLQRGESSPAVLPPPAPPPARSPAPARSGWRKWLGVSVVVASFATAALLFFPKGARREAAIKQSQTKPATALPSGNTELAGSASSAPDTAKTEAMRAKAQAEAQIEAARLAEEKKQSDGMAAAAKLKTDVEAAARLKAETEAAAKEKERQIAAAAAVLAREKEAAMQRALQEQQRKAALAAVANDKVDQAPTVKTEVAVATAANSTPAKPEGKSAASETPASNEITNSIGMVLVHLPSGIWVGKYEVTQAEYRKVMGTNPSKSPNDHRPVERVTWNEAIEFVRKLTEMERGKLPAGNVYSLPTEAQWKEYAGGQEFKDLPNGGVTGRSEPLIVGESGPANKFGLFDVLGNVWEWCLDGATGEEKLLKGGAFNSINYDRTLLPDRQASNCGFRCVLIPQ